ncbi:MAG: FKBP-type peptidyl-prolyl cis-trans isomerase [Leptospira sp.]|nr:FKBP-type peptidyl-prolyl cis-trans isomerase [Leptospira sp.]
MNENNQYYNLLKNKFTISRNKTLLFAVILLSSIGLYAQSLGIKDVKIGKGKEALKGTQVTVHYVGKLENGTKFDSSRDRGTPFTFILGEGQVIQGWDKGVLKMREGGIRKLVIPPSLGYGARNVGSIPANSVLHFEVELLKVR